VEVTVQKRHKPGIFSNVNKLQATSGSVGSLTKKTLEKLEHTFHGQDALAVAKPTVSKTEGSSYNL